MDLHLLLSDHDPLRDRLDDLTSLFKRKIAPTLG